MTLVYNSSIGVYHSAKPDVEGYYHIFYPNGDRWKFQHIRLRSEELLSAKTQGIDVGGALVESFKGLMSHKGIQASAMSSKPLHIEYRVQNPVQKQSILVHNVATGTLEHAIFQQDTTEIWHPTMDLVARAVMFPTDSRLFQEPSVVEPSLPSYGYDHQVDGVAYGREKAAMHPGVRSLLRQVDGEIESLAKRLQAFENSGASGVQVHLTRHQLTYLQGVKRQAIAFEAHKGQPLIDSNYYRDLIKEEEAKKRKEIESREGAARGLSPGEMLEVQNNAAHKYIPFLSNCWSQSSQVMGTKSTSREDPKTWMRSGAFYDARCSMFSLEELIDSSCNTDEGVMAAGGLCDRAAVVIDKMVDELGLIEEKLFKKLKKHGEDNKKVQQLRLNRAAIVYALERLAYVQTTPHLPGDEVSYSISRHQTPPKAGMPRINIAGLVGWVAEKRAIAQTQFLSLLEGQVAQIKPGDTELKWIHMSLLRMNYKKFDKGASMNEKREAEDMKWAFDHFRDAKICFEEGVTSPKIEYDEHGKPIKITLNRSLATAGQITGEITLKSYCMSCAPAPKGAKTLAKYLVVDGGQPMTDQEEFNRQFWADVVSTWTDVSGRNKELLDLLRQGKSNFEIGEVFALEAMKHGYAFSTCCQSGKDRTGYICSRIAQRIVLDGLDRARDSGRLHASEHQRLHAHLDVKPFEAQRITQKILAANTGAHYIKVGVLQLPGRGFGRRVSHYLGLAAQENKIARTVIHTLGMGRAFHPSTHESVDKKFTI